MRSVRLLATLVVATLLLTACGSNRGDAQFGSAVSAVSDIVGRELTANRVVSLPCIASRRDPVGVWLGVRVVDARVATDSVTIDMEETEARLGSHPSGCRNPAVLLAQSVFLFGDDDPIFARTQSIEGAITTLEFELDGEPAADLDVVILPTFEFQIGNGQRQTTIFGLIGRYSLR